MRMLAFIAMLMVLAGGAIVYGGRGGILELEGVLFIGFGLTIGAIEGMANKQVKLLEEIRDLLRKEQIVNPAVDAPVQTD